MTKSRMVSMVAKGVIEARQDYLNDGYEGLAIVSRMAVFFGDTCVGLTTFLKAPLIVNPTTGSVGIKVAHGVTVWVADDTRISIV